ncbi:3-methyl-2-oxobutanoate hydroxymethyltransferase [uncultured Gammaproteobacteria bacterium]
MSSITAWTDVHARIKHLYDLRVKNPDLPRIKVNLYRGYEVEAVADAVNEVTAERGRHPIDCLMVADSYLMTHLGRSSTRLAGEEEQAWFMGVMCGLIAEIASSNSRHFSGKERPFVLGDMPEGAAATPDVAVRNALRFIEIGADAVKIEAADTATLAAVSAVTKAGVPVIVHLGYTPQSSASRRFGVTRAEALDLFAMAVRARDVGACALVLERVTVAVNARLSIPVQNGLPIYSIFSGRCRHAGQSLNVWDSVFKRDTPTLAFPPTADLMRASYPGSYSREVIRSHFGALLRLTLDGGFPVQPPRATEPDLDDISPWDC